MTVLDKALGFEKKNSLRISILVFLPKKYFAKRI